jgi:hypothetical protein
MTLTIVKYLDRIQTIYTTAYYFYSHVNFTLLYFNPD